jgi:hypothetical protein
MFIIQDPFPLHVRCKASSLCGTALSIHLKLKANSQLEFTPGTRHQS